MTRPTTNHDQQQEDTAQQCNELIGRLDDPLPLLQSATQEEESTVVVLVQAPHEHAAAATGTLPVEPSYGKQSSNAEELHQDLIQQHEDDDNDDNNNHDDDTVMLDD
jgi:hypothetical protein